jgi:CSLREA domain-containing protein
MLRRCRNFLLPIACALVGCRDHMIPTDPSREIRPGRAAFTEVASGPVVNSLNDPGDGTCDETECTLREAIAFADPGATITFAPTLTEGGPAQIVLVGNCCTNPPFRAALVIDKDVTIAGPGADRLTITPSKLPPTNIVPLDRVFIVSGSVAQGPTRPTVVISGLTIAGGHAQPEISIAGNPSFGGGVLNNGNLTLSHVVVTGSEASSGGGIHTTGHLTLISSSVSNNVTGASGGALQNDPNAITDVINSTFFANTGSAVWADGPLFLEYSTIAFNDLRYSSGFAVTGALVPTGVSVVAFATIISNNGGSNCVGVADGGFNIDDGLAVVGLCNFSQVTSTPGFTDPRLGSPGQNGGPTPTIALQAGSPAIDFVPRAANGCTTYPTLLNPTLVVTLDQRDVPRSGRCDIGAFEAVGVVGAPDTKPPVLTLPGDQTLSATSPSGAVATFTATAMDDFDGAVAVSCAPSSGSTFPIGTTQVACSARDAAGNTATESFKVTVRDTKAPVLTLPTDRTVIGPPNGIVVTFTASALDDVSGAVAVSCDLPSGSMFPIGVNNVLCVAKDAAGNVATGSFTITVLKDTKPPVLTLPSDLTLAATSPYGAVAIFTPSAVDDIDGPVDVSCNPPSGLTFPIARTLVGCSAIDASGNVAMGSFNVTVLGAQPQLSTLESTINGLALDASTAGALLNVVTGAESSLAKGNTAAACSKLADLLSMIPDKVAAGKLTPSAAMGLTSAATRIRTVLGC